jgi:hypothetical protein
MFRKLFTYGVGLLTVLSLTTPLSYAADCTIIYGGGEIPCATTPTIAGDQPTATPTTKKQPTATPTKKPTNQPKPTNPPQTKGGLPVHSPTQTKTTPPTGPEAFSLLALIPAAAAGIYLRKKKI